MTEDVLPRLVAALRDRYAVEREIGSGGMATVYLAEDLKHHRQVAIKVLDPDLARTLGAERFLREIETAAGLTHPHILPLFDSGEADGFLYYVMPFLEGESLRDRLDREKQLPVEDALRISREVADALGHAHALGIVHRDIKPGNILFEAGHAVVADFGIARAVDAAGGESLTQTGLAIGTPAYMSPEQVAGAEDLDGRSDLYSLGCVLYEMLGGETPYLGRTPQAMIAKKLTEPVPRISVIRESVPGAVEEALVKALARTPADRYTTAAELSAELVLDTAVGTGRPPSARGGAWRLAAAVMAGLVIGGTVLSVLGGDEEVAEPAVPTDLVRFAALNADRPTIAVLPLANLSAEEENSYFAAGIHEELLRLLSLVRGLGVVSRTSVLRYAGTDRGIPEIAAELGARYIVEGSVQEDQGQVRIQVQLIDATTDQHLWANRYDRSLEDVFALQSEVAQAIAGELQAAVSPEERERIETRPSQDPIAYDLYLRAVELNFQDREEYDTQVELVRRATRMDPGFALAHAHLARLFWGGLVSHGYPPFDSAIARADLAVAADPDLSVAQAIKGITLVQMEQHEAGVAVLRRALTLDPSNGYAWGHLAAAGYWSGDPVGGALAGRRGARLDRASPYAALYLGYSLMAARMYDEATAWFDRTVELDADNAWGVHGLLLTAISAGKLEGARALSSRIRDVGADNPMTLSAGAWIDVLEAHLEAAKSALEVVVQAMPDFSLASEPTAQTVLAWVMARSGDPEGLDRLERLRELRMEQWESGPALDSYVHDLLVIASVLGDEEEQLRWFLESVPLDHQGEWYLLRNAPHLDQIRDRPEFQAWLEETNRRLAAERRELEAMGPWMPEEVLGLGAGNR